MKNTEKKDPFNTFMGGIFLGLSMGFFAGYALALKWVLSIITS